MSLFVAKYLKPQFDKDSLDTEIWLGTINYPNPEYVRAFLRNNGADKIVKGIGVQWSGMKALPTVHKEYPAYEYMQTENMCGNSENDWSALENTWKAVVNCFNNGVGSYMYWNMVLDETCKSWWEWAQNTLVIVDRNTKQVKYTDEFYLMKHLSHFVQPGSRFVASSDKQNMLAFKTADGKFVVVCYNPDDNERVYVCRINSKSYKTKLKPKSINTIVFDKI